MNATKILTRATVRSIKPQWIVRRNVSTVVASENVVTSSTVGKKQYVLGIETSCDDTGVAIVSSDREVVAEAVNTQWDAHKNYRGVVPTIATREHANIIDSLVERVMRDAGAMRYADLAAVAVTAGPGMAYCLEVGVKKAKALAAVHGIPLIGVNHMEGHALTARLTNPDLEFPFLTLLVSGGHTQLTVCKGVGEYAHLGSSLDNALGEVYDKIARELDILYAQEGISGGEAVENLAKEGNPRAFTLEMPLRQRVSCDFSFSGILSVLTKRIKEEKERSSLNHQIKADIAASFQHAVLAHIGKNTQRALAWCAENLDGPTSLVVSGGVARNAALRESLNAVALGACVRAVYPPARWCTDNGVMIAWAGVERLRAGLVDTPETVTVRPRWPLDQSGRSHFPATYGNATSVKHKSNYVLYS